MITIKVNDAERKQIWLLFSGLGAGMPLFMLMPDVIKETYQKRGSLSHFCFIHQKETNKTLITSYFSHFSIMSPLSLLNAHTCVIYLRNVLCI